MITILNTLNENIINLGESLKVGGIGVDKNERVNDDSRQTKEDIEISKSLVDHFNDLN